MEGNGTRLERVRPVQRFPRVLVLARVEHALNRRRRKPPHVLQERRERRAIARVELAQEQARERPLRVAAEAVAREAADGRSIRANVGVELKGVRWSSKASRTGIESEGWAERDAGKSP